MKAENADATVWLKGLQYLRRHGGVKAVYDLSATPFYLKGSGWSEGLIFPWTVSDFSLMDAIESGIVKIPRLPVDDDAEGKDVSYLHLYDRVKDDPNWPTSAKGIPPEPGQWVIPKALEGALRSLYKSYENSFTEWEQHLRAAGEPPPVMIVVSPNTLVSKLIFDWIAGYEKVVDETRVHVKGELEKFSNVVDDQLLARPRTIIVDSKQLESDDVLKGDFKDAAAEEIEAFKKQYRQDNPGADVDKITDKELLREVMNTVGKKGKLGEQVRCVVSVAMLTEGWDANTVTHILGIRAFGSQLLCEQVVGRGLRRRSYAPDPETGFFGRGVLERLWHPIRLHPVRQARRASEAGRSRDARRGTRRSSAPPHRVPRSEWLPCRAAGCPPYLRPGCRAHDHHRWRDGAQLGAVRRHRG